MTDSTTFTYDGFGRRIGKYSNLTGGHGCLHDGDNLLAELDTAGNILTHYTYYPGVDVPHSVFLPGRMQTYYMATEVPGNVTGLMTPGGVLAASWEYDEWGTPRTLSGADSIPMPLRFAAREYDSETGLYYNRARYYDPVTARFLSEDPIGLAGGTNLYTYAGNNPVNNTDPSGNFCTAYETKSVGVITGTVYSDVIDLSPGCWGGGGGGSSSSGWAPFDFRGPGGYAFGGPMGGGGGGALPFQQTVGQRTPTSTPVHGLWTYGNWCGSGGQGTPINATDAACQAHDACYAQYGFSAGSNFSQGSNTALRGCNQNLCNSVRSRSATLRTLALARARKLPFFAKAPPQHTPQERVEQRMDGEINFYFTTVVAPWGGSCQ